MKNSSYIYCLSKKWNFHQMTIDLVQIFISLILQEWTPNHYDSVLIPNFFVLFLHFQVTLRFLLSIYSVSLLKWQKLSLFLFLHNSFFSIHFFKVFICYSVFKAYFPFTIYYKILALFPMVYTLEPVLHPWFIAPIPNSYIALLPLPTDW